MNGSVHVLQSLLSFEFIVSTLTFYVNAIPQGQQIEGTSRIQKDSSPTAIDWHPTKKVLAIGWETGDIQLWNDVEKNLYEPQSDHCSQIKSLNWTGNGTRLLSADFVRDKAIDVT